MKALDACTKEQVDIRLWHGQERVEANRYQEFAAHYKGGGWRISHLPSGHAVARDFPTLEDAAEAMVSIAKLRNDWAIIGNDDLTVELRMKVEKIANQYGGHVRTGSRPYAIDLNGYTVHS